MKTDCSRTRCQCSTRSCVKTLLPTIFAWEHFGLATTAVPSEGGQKVALPPPTSSSNHQFHTALTTGNNTLIPWRRRARMLPQTCATASAFWVLQSRTGAQCTHQQAYSTESISLLKTTSANLTSPMQLREKKNTTDLLWQRRADLIELLPNLGQFLSVCGCVTCPA